MPTNLTPRERAGAILSGAKMRMLEEAGIAVADRARLEALEQVANATWRYIEATASFSGTQRHRYEDMVNSIEALEAMTDGQVTDSNAETDSSKT